MTSTIIFIDYELCKPNIAELTKNPEVKVFVFLNSATKFVWPKEPISRTEFIRLPVARANCSFFMAYFIGRERLRNPEANFQVFPENEQLNNLGAVLPSTLLTQSGLLVLANSGKNKSNNNIKATTTKSQSKSFSAPIQQNPTGSKARQLLNWLTNEMLEQKAAPKNTKNLKIFFNNSRLNATKI